MNNPGKPGRAGSQVCIDPGNNVEGSKLESVRVYGCASGRHLLCLTLRSERVAVESRRFTTSRHITLPTRCLLIRAWAYEQLLVGGEEAARVLILLLGRVLERSHLGIGTLLLLLLLLLLHVGVAPPGKSLLAGLAPTVHR